MSLSYRKTGQSTRTQVSVQVSGAPMLCDERAYPAADGTHNLTVAFESHWIKGVTQQTAWAPVWVRVDATGCDAVWSWQIVSGHWVPAHGEAEMPLWVAESVDRLRPVGWPVSRTPRGL